MFYIKRFLFSFSSFRNLSTKWISEEIIQKHFSSTALVCTLLLGQHYFHKKWPSWTAGGFHGETAHLVTAGLRNEISNSLSIPCHKMHEYSQFWLILILFNEWNPSILNEKCTLMIKFLIDPKKFINDLILKRVQLDNISFLINSNKIKIKTI